MKSVTSGQSTTQTFTTMRLMGTQQYLTAQRYQMKSITLFYENEVEAAVKVLKMGNLAITLISHPSKAMLMIILNSLQPQQKRSLKKSKLGSERNEQIFNLRILCEKYLQYQQNLYHVFIDFEKAFDRVWHKALWAAMRKFNQYQCEQHRKYVW